MPKNRHWRRTGSQSWDGVAGWYAGWNGSSGSRYHKRLAIPLMLDMLQLKRDDSLADLGCGPGTLTPAALEAGAAVTGVDLSPRLIALARRSHSDKARFLVGDATRVASLPQLKRSGFDAVSFLLSVQDIAPLEGAMQSASWLLRPGGRLAIVMLHPCFRVPRQSGWGWDEGRSLRFRRVDSYLSDLAVPMQPHAGSKGSTRSYHRPLHSYVHAITDAGMSITALREVADSVSESSDRADRRAKREFPLFIGIRADKPG